MDKKTILAVVLISLVLLVHARYMSKHYPQPAKGPKETAGPVSTEEVGGVSAISQKSAEKPGGLQVAEEIKKPQLPLQEISVETEKFVVTLSNEGGCVKSIFLRDFPDPNTNEAFKLVDIDKTEDGIFNMAGLGEEEHLLERRFFVKRDGNEVEFSTNLKNGAELKKKYIFSNSSYDTELEIYIANKTSTSLHMSYTIVAGSNIDMGTRIERNYTQIVSDVGGKSLRSRGGKNEVFSAGSVKYTGLQNRYFSVLTRPSTATQGTWSGQTEAKVVGKGLFGPTTESSLISRIETEKFNLPAGAACYHNYLLYVGPTDIDELAKYDLQGALSYGMWGGISKILVAGLKFFYLIFRNWGIAVILVAVAVNLLLFPLMRKSYVSMKKVQELQPQLEKLRSEHKDNPNKLNKEMMELYKKYNVNPLGGCLPIFFQLPIILAFWQALMRSIDLRGARFLWIRDLSGADTVARLPFSLPVLGDTINILPILMTVAMVMQQKIATQKTGKISEQQKQQQKMMLIMFPAMFLVFMYHAPSGLVLYWLTNTLLTMFEQRAIMQG